MREPCELTAKKPRLLFLRSTAPDRAEYIRLHLQEHVKCLSEFFAVTVVSEDDCDYKQLCEQHRPDIALFESGVYVAYDRRRTIRSTEAYPEIPKLGFCNADAYCESRKLFLSDMLRWGVEAFFTLSVSMAEYTPDIADRLFVWPNFADGDIYRDYSLHKLIPILFTGSFATHYPWRNKIYKRISECYPSLRCPHYGWGSKHSTERMIFGESYARLLNGSMLAPACGTIANEIVRKHFEVPGAKACLIAQRTDALEAAGFVDMRNCVFAEESDVLDKVDYLFTRREELERITQAGYDLVHSNHTLKHRDQLYQWFTLYKMLGPDEKIVQPGPFQPLTVVGKNSGIGNRHVSAHGVDRLLLKQGDERLWAGRYSEAEALFLKCLSYHDMAEPKLRLVITKLFAGDSAGARYWSLQPIKSTLEGHAAATPDPVEWAYMILTALCNGEQNQALESAAEFAALRHPELDRIRFLMSIVANRRPSPATLDIDYKPHFSVHHLPERDLNTWFTHVCRMLEACNQRQFAERIVPVINGLGCCINTNLRCHEQRRDRSLPTSKIRLFKAASSEKVRAVTLRRARRLSGKLLRGFEGRLGYFLPYSSSLARSDEFLHTVERLSRDENITAVSIIGACAGNYVTEACLQGVRRNSNVRSVICMSSTNALWKRLLMPTSHNEHVHPEGGAKEKTQHEDAIGRSTLIVIDGSEGSVTGCQHEHFSGAGIVVLHDLNSPGMFDIFQALTLDPSYAITDQNLEHQNGYAIFRKIRD